MRLMIIFCLLILAGVSTAAEIPDPSVYYGKYLSAVNFTDSKVRRLAADLTEGCGGSAECQIVRLYGYVQKKVRYISDPAELEFIQTPAQTLSVMAGDCEDLSILLYSLMKSIRLDAEFMITDTHMYLRTCGIDRYSFMNEVNSAFSNDLVLADTRQKTKAGSIWSVTFTNMNDSNRLYFEINSDNPVSHYLLVSDSDFKKMLKREDYRYFDECSGEKDYNSAFECDVGRRNVFVIKSEQDSDVSVKIRKAVLPDTDILFYDVKGQTCIPLDPAIKGRQVVPGMEMEKVRNSRKYVLRPKG